ncbi:hypothetical protein Pla8534_06020 [Lignipirellula cremea]|uniref:Uncharacterized protein n=2 Tax=Lignipirellula cremea TaxID=2528010 RepID=A0A518DLW3_9BACT|nr:hypothetical protein Pla8534_06020 [Lignipirellula cremea]
MKTRSPIAASLLVLLMSVCAAAAPPWMSFVPFRKVEADPNKAYELTEQNGPWLIMCAAFAGEGAARQAHDLVIELRRQHGMKAYVVNQHYDFSEAVEGIGLTKEGQPKRMRHQHNDEFDEYAVLVGDFESVYDPTAEKTLDQLKSADPDALNVAKRKMTTQRLVTFRRYVRTRSGRPAGTMGAAFITRNPLLPAEYFAPKGLDPLVAKMNQEVQYSLLKCPGKYSVKVGSYRGKVTLDQKEVERLESQPLDYNGGGSKLAEAAEKAHRLTLALRQAGVEAYEFHDRHESIVTVGSFADIGRARPDGKIEINPAVHQVIQSYAAESQTVVERPGALPQTALVPHTFAGVPFDIQPVPVEVPQISIATQYAPRESLFNR